MRYRIGGKEVPTDPGAALAALRAAYAKKQRVECLCTDPAPLCYLAKIGETIIVKRMPNTGAKHDPECEHYEAPPELSGRGEVEGTAIKENEEEGTTELRLGFPLSKVAGRAPPAPSGTEKTEGDVVVEKGKLSLQATLHYLWEQAGFNRWTPAFAGKRRWATIHKYLLEAAAGKHAKRRHLSDVLFVPEPYFVDKADDIAAARRRRFAELRPEKNSLFLVVAPLKDLAPSQFGMKLVLKHMPGKQEPLYLTKAAGETLQKRYAGMMQLAQALEGSQIIVIATVQQAESGVLNADTVAMMLVDRHFLPVDSFEDADLTNALVAEERRFVKGLRYNLSRSTPMATLQLTDVAGSLAMYLIPRDADELFRPKLESLMAESSIPSWTWESTEPMPAIPPPTSIERANPRPSA